MKLQALLVLSAACAPGLFVPAAYADSYSTTTIEESRPVTELSETRTTNVESAPSRTMVVREQPVIITQPATPEVIVVKRHHHHLINVGPVKVF
jgi:hypothetical protein